MADDPRLPRAAVPQFSPVAPAPPAIPVSAAPSPIAAPRQAPAAAVPPAGDQPVAASMAAAPSRPVADSITLDQLKALGSYMAKTEVHTYAFSVAAQVILSLFPFIIMLLTISDHVFHSKHMAEVVSQIMQNFLPKGGDVVMKRMSSLATRHPATNVWSILTLLITSTGVFLPLEVALNSVWGVDKNRSYLANQVVSIGLAAGVGLLAITSVALTTAQQTVVSFVFFGHTEWLVVRLIGGAFIQLCSLLAGVGLFFLIYWGLPNRKVPPKAVLPTAVVIGVLWTIGKYIYIFALPHLDFDATYGPFSTAVALIMWAFISGLLLLAGAYVSATRQALRETRAAEIEAAQAAA